MYSPEVLSSLVLVSFRLAGRLHHHHGADDLRRLTLRGAALVLDDPEDLVPEQTLPVAGIMVSRSERALCLALWADYGTCTHCLTFKSEEDCEMWLEIFVSHGSELIQRRSVNATVAQANKLHVSSGEAHTILTQSPPRGQMMSTFL